MSYVVGGVELGAMTTFGVRALSPTTTTTMPVVQAYFLNPPATTPSPTTMPVVQAYMMPTTSTATAPASTTVSTSPTVSNARFDTSDLERRRMDAIVSAATSYNPPAGDGAPADTGTPASDGAPADTGTTSGGADVPPSEEKPGLPGWVLPAAGLFILWKVLK